jgi:ATP-dependent RNA helicase RhlB
MRFENLNINENILKAISEIGYENCTPVQEQSLPECLTGKDIISQSQTGTGKTAVFLITILNRLGETESAPSKPRAVIMAPTRELAEQIDLEAKKLCQFSRLKSIAIYGGVGYERQEKALAEGVDIVAATPGRLIDLCKSKTISFSSVEVFVVDEADRMFDMGFAPDIKYIADNMPRNHGRQTMLFSATINNDVRRLATQYMRKDAVEIEIEPEQITVDLIDQKIIYVSNKEKLQVLMALLKREETLRAIVFTNMKRTAERLGWTLSQNGFEASVLTGDVNQAKRQRIIDKMKSGKTTILIATDVAARGLHIEEVSHVINFDLPQDAANYVHRIGRTARAGKSGKAYSLACEDLILNLPDIEKYIGHKIEKEWISEADLPEDVAGPYQPHRKLSAKEEHGKGKERVKKEQKKVTKKSESPKKAKPAVSSTPKSKQEKKSSGKKSRNKNDSGKSPKQLDSNGRLEYYKKKYGENFVKKGEGIIQTKQPEVSVSHKDVKSEPVVKEKKKKLGVLKRILKVFRN